MGQSMLPSKLKTVLVIVTMVVTMVTVHCLQVAINADLKDEIVKKHNDVRRKVAATYMMELGWDDTLAWKAEQWSSQCRYEYPPWESYDAGFNMYWARNNILDSDIDTIREFLTNALHRWESTGRDYLYASHCNRSCPYTQMIQASVENIGCSVQNCDNYYRGGRNVQGAYTMVVCFYNPRIDLRSSPPYMKSTRYDGCTRCPRNRICDDNLCALRDKPRAYKPPARNYPVAEALDPSEERALVRAHNDLRRSWGFPNLVWDDTYLKKWANYIIHCTVDYPGPRGTYTNFYRLQQREEISNVVDNWSREGSQTNLRLVHGCRTKNDQTACNHYTNMMTPDTNYMFCAAKRCGDRRHLVCIYDNVADRYEGAYRYRQTYDSAVDVRTTRSYWNTFRTPRPDALPVRNEIYIDNSTRRPPPSVYTRPSRVPRPRRYRDRK